MKRSSAVSKVVVVLVLSFLVAASTVGQTVPDYVEGELIIKFKQSTSPGDISGVQSSLGAVVLHRFTGIEAEHWKIQSMTVEEAVDLYDGDSRVQYIEPNYIVRTNQTFPNDPNFPQMWGLHNTGQTGGTADADIDAPEGWDFETGEEVLVGNIDTGTDWNHEDLADNIYINPLEIPNNGIDDDGNGFTDDVRGWDFVNNDNNPDDDAGHGTHTAGTIGAVGNNGIGVVGVSWNVKIMPIKFLNSGGSGTTANAIKAVEYATLMGMNLTNNSWGGGGYSQGLRDAIEDAGDDGILFVAAAGNGGTDTDLNPHYPSSYDLDNIISVANTDHNDNLWVSSNWGATSVDLGAPGRLILSTLPGNGYGSGTGTSMASPHVAGAVSLLWSAAPDMPHLEVKDMILGAVDVIPALAGKTVTGGRLNIFNFISTLDSIPPAKVLDLAVASTSSNTATLTWTATGDDSTDGTATRYDIRYSESQIYWSNFDLATPVPNPPAPLPSGSPETFEVWGLDFNTAYSFALKVYDEQDNVSWISNLPSMATTLGISQLAYAPTSFTENLLTGGTATQILTVENTGEGTLDYSFSGLPGWLTANPESGRVAAGQSGDQVDIVFKATALQGGVHSGNITLHTNDPAQTTVVIPVTLNVTSAPDIIVAADSLDFGPLYIGLTTSLPLRVSNIGAIPLNVSAVSIDNAEFDVDPAGFVLQPWTDHILTVEYVPATVGPVAGTLSIYSDDPDQPQLDVSLAGEGIDPPILSISPTSFSETLYTGGTSSQLMTISNNGGSDLQYEITTEEPETTATFAVETRLNIPRSDGNFPRGSTPPSIGLAPQTGAPVATSSSAPIITGTGGSSFATEAANSQFMSFNLNVPEVLNFIAPAPQFIWVGDFALGDNSFVYAVDDLNRFMQIDTTTGNQTVLNTLTPFVGEDFTGMATDPTTGEIYLSSTNITASSLYRLDVVAQSAWRIGPIGFPGIIAIAVDDQGDMYAHDIVTDELVRIDKATGAGTAVGSLGYDANFAQGMAFDPVSGELLLAAFNNAAFEAQLRVADRTTGATLVLGVLGSTVPGGTVQLGWLGIPPSGVPWLALDPTTGTVPPGTSVDVTVTFDALGVEGGDYHANIVVATADPLNDDQVVPASLHVIGAPNVSVSDTLLSFGQLFVGDIASRTLVVTNTGTELLSVSSVSTSDADYTVDVTSFDLVVGASQDIEVSFSPTTVALIPGVLTIASNDPDEPALTVELAGEGLDPPVISVSPASLSDSLYTGQSSSHLMTISNGGGSDLLFDILPEETDGAAAYTVETRLSIPRSNGDFPRGTAPPSIGTPPLAAAPTAPSSTAPIITGAGSSSFASDATTLQFMSFNLNVPEVLNSIALAPQFIWAGDFALGDNSLVYALNDLNQFMEIDTTTGTQTVLGTLTPSGGETFTGMATDPTTGDMYLSSTDISSSMLYLLDAENVTATPIGPTGFPGIIAIAVDDQGDMYAHDIVTDELVRIDKATGSGTTVGSLGFDANFGQGMAFDPASGELLLAAFNNATFEAQLRVADRTTGATTLLGVLGSTVPGGAVQLGWLATPPSGLPWLAADPTTGTVPPGTSMDVTITFDAEGLFGGDYNADIVVASNDPISPEVAVPAHLHVTGAPDLAVSDTSLDYGQVFIGATIIDSLVVKNIGTDLLAVGSVSTDHPDYSVDVTNFNLNPAESQIIQVSFVPATAAVLTGTLTITSNDPDEPVVTVDLNGEGVEPPVITVSPDSLSEDLVIGETSTQYITIGNTGTSDLTFGIDIDEQPGVVVSMRARTRSDASDKPQGTNVVASPRPVHSAPTDLAPDEWAGGAVFDVGGTVPPSQASVIFEDDFEDGDFDGWQIVGGGTKEVTDSTAANGTVYSYHESNSPYGHFDGVYKDFGASQPGYVGFYISSGSTNTSDAYVVLRDAGGTDVIWFFARGNSLLYCNADVGGDESVTYSANRWYHIEFKDIDFTAQSFDYYVDEVLIKADIPFRYAPFVDDIYRVELYNFAEFSEAWWDEIFISTGEEPMSWVSANPTGGTVPPGTSVDIEVTFDATNIFGGDYNANINIHNNDPLNPVVAVPAYLNVTGTPDVSVSETHLAYGEVFIGATAVNTVVVENVGTDLLVVNDVSTDHSDYTVDVTNFSLNPTESQIIQVYFAPTTAAVITGTLTIASNDPDEPVVTVDLEGEGLVAPVIAVTPDSLGTSLYVGDVETQQLVIDNTGGSDLNWSINIQSGPVQQYTLTAPTTDNLWSDGQEVGALPGFRTTPITAELKDLTGVHIMWDRSHGQNLSIYSSVIISDLMARGAVVTENTDPITPSLLEDYDMVWLIDMSIDWSPDETAAISNWAHQGGGLLFESDQSIEIINTLLSAMGAGFVYSHTDPGAGFTTNIYPHETTESVDSVWVGGPLASVDSIGSPAGRLVDDYFGVSLAAYSEVQFGRIVALSDEVFFDYAIGNGNNQLFANQAVDWLAAGVSWLAVDPTEGTTPAGGTDVLDVIFDATATVPGDYEAFIEVASNDPTSPAVFVSTAMEVAGASNISVSDSLLDFGPVIIGNTRDLQLVVSNIGNDDLVVTDISADHSDVGANPTSFTVVPGDSRSVTVTYGPTTDGPVAATLTITSNDPDQGQLAVALEGEGLIPPQIAVSPDSLHDDLFSGQMSMHTLTISNAGGSDLVFAIQTTETTGAAAPVVALAPGAENTVAESNEPAASDSAASVSWLSLSQTAGTVPAGDNVDISVMFDATQLIGGAYSADISISTNIPNHPGVVIPATLDVTGAPNIAVSDTLLEFGTVYIGYPETVNFVVSNTGTDVLTVSDIEADQPEFTTSPTVFQLAVGGDQVVQVTYDPASAGATAAILTISSDDPDQATVEIDLVAEALEPPVIAVSVDSLDVTVPAGDTVVETFTIQNTGGSDLDWGVEAGFPTNAPLRLATPISASGAKHSRSSPAKVEQSASSIIHVLWYGDHGLGGINLWSTMISDIQTRGATVTQSFDPVTPALLSDVSVLWLGNAESSFSPAERTAIVDWVNGGGSILIEADNDASVTAYSQLLTDLQSGLAYTFIDGFAGITNVIFPHVTTADVDRLYLLAPSAQVASSAPGGSLFSDLIGAPMGAYSEVGDGRIVIISDQIFHDIIIGQTDNRLFGNQVFGWLALGGFNWLTITPPTGTVAASDSVEISLEMDGSILPTGSYDLNLEVISNDPANPMVTIPMHVVVDSLVTITGVTDDQVPNVYRLHPNYPNPFNPTTTIRYDLPAPQNVHVVIYNVRGEKVRVLVDEHQPAGRHESVWDGRNSRGESVASGVYLYRIVAGEFVDTRKMILLK